MEVANKTLSARPALYARKHDHNSLSRFCWGAKCSRKCGVRAVLGYHNFKQTPYNEYEWHGNGYLEWISLLMDIYIYIQYTIPRPSFGTEKGVPFYFCSIWFFLLGSGGPKKKRSVCSVPMKV